jgi:hypothetical protein
MQVCNPTSNPNPATMTTPTSKNIIDQMLENDLDLLGHQVINTHGQERVDYWKAFQVRRRLAISRNPE